MSDAFLPSCNLEASIIKRKANRHPVSHFNAYFLESIFKSASNGGKADPNNGGKDGGGAYYYRFHH